MSKRLSPKVKQVSRKLRRRQTTAEIILWEKLRNRRLKGIKFLRQHPIVFHQFGRERFFVADFYCAEAGLIVELDGGIHKSRREYDRARDFILRSMGYRVVRIGNERVVMDLRGVVGSLSQLVANSPPAGR